MKGSYKGPDDSDSQLSDSPTGSAGEGVELAKPRRTSHALRAGFIFLGLGIVGFGIVVAFIWNSQRDPVPGKKALLALAPTKEVTQKSASPSLGSSHKPRPAAPAGTVTHKAGSATRKAGLPARKQGEQSKSNQPDLRLQATLAKRDPFSDGWDTEVLNEVAGAQLKAIGKLISHHEELEKGDFDLLTTADISCSSLRPPNLSPSFTSEAVQVFTSTRSLSVETKAIISTGRDSLVETIRSLAAPFAGSDDVHTKFKIIRVEVEGGEIETEVYYQASGTTERGIIQQNATLICGWIQEKSATGDRPALRLTRLAASNFTEVIGPAGGQPLLADCTEAVLGENPSFADQLMKSTNHWRRSLQSSLGVDIFGHQGLAIGDANGDGLEDIYVCQPGGVPNRLYIQNADGTADDDSSHSGLDLLDRSRSALFLDLDNDADQDLVLLLSSTVVFFANDGQGKFTIEQTLAVGTATTLAAADYDNDGDLDIYICGYSAPVGGESAPIPYHDANNGNRNRLLRNDGAWKFSDVTVEVGLDRNNTRFTLSASWEDFDNDGDMDLYVANDFGRNCLYRNDGGQFVNIAAEAGVEDLSAGMGVSWGDYNNDGLMDIYVSNMFSSAGNRVAFQRKFRDDDNPETRSMFQRHARGNSLFENAGDGTFRDVSVEAAVTMGRWAWGSVFTDLNNDGWRDLLVTNGLATNEDTGDL